MDLHRRQAATGPVFDEQFAITGGTGRYQNALGQVRVVDRAKVTFRIQL
jgi:long-subunit acyl-CoA synthetase (AMP-forming)